MTAKIFEMPKSSQQLWDDANKLHIGEFADHFTRWMDEYAKKQQVSCGNGAQRDSATVLSADRETPAGIYQGNSEPSADDPYYDDEPYWSDGQTAIERQNSIKGR